MTIKLFMKLIFFCAVLILKCSVLFSQGEEIAPMISNPDIVFNTKSNNKNVKASSLTFDSTFLYFPDTLKLPFFDEFSKNKFQQYSANFSDLGVTSDKKYHLIDNSTLLPLSLDSIFSSDITYHRIVNIDNITYTDVHFNPHPIKIGSLVSYPISYVTTNVYPPYYIYDSLGVSGDISDTIWIPSPIKQDSATKFFAYLNDTNSYWLDSYAYHNYRFAVNPWSIGVATFDGLDDKGKAYSLGSISTNYADYLTSKPIDLSINSASDSIYLSFLYQSGGFGEEPDETDSLILEFYSKDLDQWNRIWSAKGTADLEFKVGHIPIKNVQYFKKGFQFRFKNYGRISGSFDVFNLDYVNLRASSGHQDTLFKDFAWVYPITTLLNDYTSVPWDHYKSNFPGKMSPIVNLVVRNGSNIFENTSTPGKIEIEYDAVTEGAFTITGNSFSGGVLNYAPRTIYSTLHDLSGGYQYDASKLGTNQTFTIIGTAPVGFENYPQNDSTFSEQYFGNFYSYDDGSAEAAYGVTGTESELAVQYIPYESDSIIGVMTNFVEAATDVSNKLFLLTVWDDDSGKPGNILYQDNIFFPRSPKYGSTTNKLYTYYFTDTLKVHVNGAFYIGWKQFDSESLNIGFDKNIITNNKTFYSNNEGISWNNSSIEGSVMIRPIFSTAMDLELNISENKISNKNLHIYPNPTTGIVQIKNTPEGFNGIDIYNIQGKLLISTTTELEIDLNNYPVGLYLFRVKNSSGKIYKVIKN